jgi:hypothetical protein
VIWLLSPWGPPRSLGPQPEEERIAVDDRGGLDVLRRRRRRQRRLCGLFGRGGHRSRGVFVPDGAHGGGQFGYRGDLDLLRLESEDGGDVLDVELVAAVAPHLDFDRAVVQVLGPRGGDHDGDVRVVVLRLVVPHQGDVELEGALGRVVLAGVDVVGKLGVELLEDEVEVGRLVDLDDLDAAAHGVGGVAVGAGRQRLRAEGRGDEDGLGGDPPAEHADVVVLAVRLVDQQPGLPHQLRGALVQRLRRVAEGHAGAGGDANQHDREGRFHGCGCGRALKSSSGLPVAGGRCGLEAGAPIKSAKAEINQLQK